MNHVWLTISTLLHVKSSHSKKKPEQIAYEKFPKRENLENIILVIHCQPKVWGKEFNVRNRVDSNVCYSGFMPKSRDCEGPVDIFMIFF